LDGCSRAIPPLSANGRYLRIPAIAAPFVG
jgi:hypothetical protein